MRRALTMVLIGLAASGCRPAVRPADPAELQPPDRPGILYDHHDVVTTLENWVIGEDGLEPFVVVSTGDEEIRGPLLKIDACCIYVLQRQSEPCTVVVPRYMVDYVLIWWDAK